MILTFLCVWKGGGVVFGDGGGKTDRRKGSKLDHFGALECIPPRRNSIPVR